jgi:glycosyltransferase involved in cell wall biosynthesis
LGCTCISLCSSPSVFVSSSSLRKELTFSDPTGGFLCVYVGRISREKRIDIIAEAIGSIDGAYLAIVGDGPDADAFQALHGKDNRIHCKPRFLTHEELAEVYASSDVHVSASQFETLGNTVLEAFACGVPVVVPRTQVLQEYTQTFLSKDCACFAHLTINILCHKKYHTIVKY